MSVGVYGVSKCPNFCRGAAGSRLVYRSRPTGELERNPASPAAPVSGQPPLVDCEFNEPRTPQLVVTRRRLRAGDEVVGPVQ